MHESHTIIAQLSTCLSTGETSPAVQAEVDNAAAASASASAVADDDDDELIVEIRPDGGLVQDTDHWRSAGLGSGLAVNARVYHSHR
jgi:hypothetical protein